MKTSKFNLMSALLNGTPLNELGMHSVCAVEREDGSGNNWNITGYVANCEPGAGDTKTLYVKKTVFCITIDR